ncbi:sulfatase [Pontiella sulfatireligans]|uniref:Choline-sulfatase n=1 Tax=Pontiella sulfatireligans TaxID=2750658 RepID=A0A6C2UHT1_9BACT|nr:sulfatase [Pontiella sulfatireligans]SPS74387.1 sulfatase S1_7 [Kiritimatiellales bacterium]VGO19750.1 Choline-sulfatase [Pontiella sulfatireligans]
MKKLNPLTVAALTFLSLSVIAAPKPNVILIVCDDLNDYVEPFGGHPQVKTPNMKRLAESGVSFKQAHCTVPICNPSRASFLTGLYPHTSQCYGFDNWDGYEVLKNSRTIMDHFRQNGYYALGTGKLMHSRGEKEWNEFGYAADYGPFAYNGEKTAAHPWIRSPFRDDFGAVDGSFGPLFKLTDEKSPVTGKPFTWRTGNWKKQRELRYESDQDRDPTGDELSGAWAVEHLKEFAQKPGGKPFFMGVGFLRPHTPLIVPQEYFDRFPLESIELPLIKENDADDTFKKTITSDKDDRSGDRGTKIYDSLIASYGGDRELALKKFIQAYLACVASVDDQIGMILDAVDNSVLKKNTMIILTSDHGWGMGEKDYLYKNSLWQESTRVPLVIRAPGVSKTGEATDVPVSLVDLYPTLIDLCGLPSNTVKNDKGRPLDGHSLKPLLENPMSGKWDGPDAALTALYKWADYYDPAEQSYSLRFKDWRYIRYSNGKEELYHTAQDPKEWTNLALSPEYASQLATFREKLMIRIPKSKPRPAPAKNSGEAWKDAYFKKNPAADANKDGTLTWPEYQIHKKALDAKQKDNKK